jgi:hypothetical protein
VSWYDFEISEAPVPCVGRLLIRGTPTPGLWDRIRAEAPPVTGRDAGVYGATFIILINDAQAFVDTLPPDMQPPVQGSPFHGLPNNVWVGGPVTTVWPAILNARARVRFLVAGPRTGSKTRSKLDEALDSWRCRICGTRGLAPRPARCPRTNLCGDGTLVSQIHWVVDETGKYTRKTKVAYWSPMTQEFPDV